MEWPTPITTYAKNGVFSPLLCKKECRLEVPAPRQRLGLDPPKKSPPGARLVPQIDPADDLGALEPVLPDVEAQGGHGVELVLGEDDPDGVRYGRLALGQVPEEQLQHLSVTQVCPQEAPLALLDAVTHPGRPVPLCVPVGAVSEALEAGYELYSCGLYAGPSWGLRRGFRGANEHRG